MMKKENCETWYRGYNSKYGFFNKKLVWLTNDIHYARLYGNRVAEVIVDTSKIKSVFISNIDIDYFDGPSDKQIKVLLDSGYNCYHYSANGEKSECMCLWDMSPIIKRRELSRKEYNDITFYCSSNKVPHYDDEYDSLTEFNGSLSKKYIQ